MKSLPSDKASFMQTLLIAGVLCMAVQSALAYGPWKPISPGGGGWCMGVFPHPTAAGKAMMNTDVGGLSVTTDSGVTWKPVGMEALHTTFTGGLNMGYLTQVTSATTSTGVNFYFD